MCDKAYHNACLSKRERNTREGDYWICRECRKCPNCLECKNCKLNLECNNKKMKCNNVIWTDMNEDKWILARERKRNCDKCWERHKDIYLADVIIAIIIIILFIFFVFF